MPYVVFALKWRPQNFDEIIGQAHLVSTLKNSLEKNRLAHAYLFSGPRGVGKTSTARILAKALNCKDGPTIDPCQKCASCKEISQGRSLDVIEIDGASNRGIEEIRALRENVKFSPVSGKFKVYIIDEVHMLTTEAFNALLKTLEEPPEFVKFIFATTQPHKVIPTILSRCQRFDFRRIPAMEMIKQLERICAAENIKVDKEVLLAIASASDGSLRDAESILDQLAAFTKDNISLKDVISVLGLVEQSALFEITDNIISKDAKAVLRTFNRIIDEGKDITTFLANLIGHFRNLMIAKITQADVKLIDLPAQTCVNLLKQSQDFSLEEIFAAFNILVNAQELSRKLESARIPLEISLVKLAHDKKAPLGAHSPVKPAEEKPVSDSHQASSNPSSQQQAVSLSLDNVISVWQNIINTLAGIKMSVATYLNEGSPVSCDNGNLIVSFPSNYSLHKESLERKENKAIIEKALAQVLGSNININFILSGESAEYKGSQGQTYVKSIMDLFKGRVIKEE